MTTAKLIINGKEIEIQLTDEQAQELTVPNKVTGFERVEHSEAYFCMDSGCNFIRDFEYGGSTDQLRYENANYYTEKSLAEWCIRNDTLNRKMRRWAAEHNTEPIDLTADTVKYLILYNGKQCVTDWIRDEAMQSLAFVYFNSDKIAQAAIEEFGDEIKWLAQNRPKWF